MRKFLLLLILTFLYNSLKSQNVGIGESSPSTKLEIRGDAGTDLLNIKNQDEESRFYIQNSGNVGIGTAIPLHRLHVIGDIAASGGIIASKLEDQITLSHDGDINQERWKIRYSNSFVDWGLQFYDVSNDAVRFFIGRESNYHGTILEPEGGNVGIGTMSPTANLDINGNLRVRSVGPGILRADNEGYIMTGTIDYAEIQNTPEGSKWDFSGNDIVNKNSGSVLVGGTSFPNPDANSILRIPARGTAGEQRNYIELQGVYANDGANEDGGAFIKFRTSTAVNYGPEIGGIRRAGGSGDFLIKTGGNNVQERFRVLDNGNVGIGTPSPGERLEVNGNIWLDGQLLGNVGRINMGATNLVISANQGNHLRLSADNQIRIESSESVWAAFTANERLGLGTTSPDERLHVSGSAIVTGDLSVPNASGSANTIRIAENHMISDHSGTLTIYGNRTTGASGEGSFKVRSHANFSNYRTDLMIDEDGNVGIGTTNPTGVLDVRGSMAGAIDSEAIIVSHNTHANGTGVAGSGQNSVINGLVNGSGGAFSGVETGLYAWFSTSGEGQAAILQDDFGAQWNVGYWNGSGYRKIIGTGSVSTIVRDLNDEFVVMNAIEAPENLFKDYGIGQLQNGRAYIEIDPILSKNIIVSERHPLKVFIQLEGECNGVYVTNKSEKGFEVIELNNGNSNAPFSYSIVATRSNEEHISPDGEVRTARYDERFERAPEYLQNTLFEVD